MPGGGKHIGTRLLPRQLQRDFSGKLGGEVNVLIVPSFRAGLHGDRGDLRIHRFDPHPDNTLICLAFERAHDIGGVVRDVFCDDRAVMVHYRNRRLVNLIHGALKMLLDIVLPKRNRRRVRIAHRFDTTGGDHGNSDQRRKNFCLHIGYNPIEKAARVKHDYNFWRRLDFTGVVSALRADFEPQARHYSKQANS